MYVPISATGAPVVSGAQLHHEAVADLPCAAVVIVSMC